MANITQTIPSYTAGISQQPDEIKVPGQVNIATNVFPDITEGLTKRPGTRFIKQLDADGAATDSQDQGKWFHYYRDETEQYLGQISRTGDINMWKCSDGSTVTVNSSGNSSAMATYLTHTADQDIQTLTLNDYTYITNRTKTTSMSSTIEAARPPEAFIQLKKVAYASQYAVNIFDDTSTITVTTATRINIERQIDSSNSCATAPGSSDTGDTFTPSGNLPGSTVGGVDYNIRCLNSSSSNTGINEDSYCPNVDTRIFAVDHGDSGEASDANNTAHTYSVTPNGGNASDRKNLYFRITTTGQSVAEGEYEDNPKYACRYTTTVDLLYGGEGWKAGDVFYVWMKNAKYKITVKSHSESKVQANLGLIRPEPTSFDTKTVVTAESILGQLQEGCEVPQNITLPTSDISPNDGVITITNHGFENLDEIKYYSNGGTNLQSGNNPIADGTTLYVKNATENTFKVHTSSGGSVVFVFSGSGNTANDNQYITKDFNVSIIGNGLYLKGYSDFNISSPVGELLNVLTDSVKDIADLPNQCKHGYVVKVANSDAEQDDYYVKFFGHNDRDGEGVWEECAKPGTNIAFDTGTMPLVLIRTADGKFRLTQLDGIDYKLGNIHTIATSSINASTGHITITNHGYTNGQKVYYQRNGGGQWILGSNLGQDGSEYFVRVIDANTIGLNIGSHNANSNLNFGNDGNKGNSNQTLSDLNDNTDYPTPKWDNAQVGDTSVDGTNPQPSFIGYTINKMMFFRNRFV